MNLKITDSAIARIKEVAANKQLPDFYFRVGVKSGGCLGLSQYFNFEFIKNDEDVMLTFDTVKIIVDPKSAKFLNGTTLAWTVSLAEKRFEIKFPEIKKHCGCGSSFSY